jgi:hypothetical protein
MKTWETAGLLGTLKVLSDESRLKMLWLLNEREYNVGELAVAMELTEPTVSHHLSKLHGAMLLNLRMDGNKRYYRLNKTALDRFKATVSEIETLVPEPNKEHGDYSWIEALGWDEADSKVLRDYTINGKLKRIPSKQKVTLVILRWLATLFEADRLYTEPEVNEVIKTIYEPDFVSLRRDLVDFGYLRRERGGGKYWLTPADEFTGFHLPE